MSGTLLFSPMTLRGVELKNRVVVPPMHQYSAVEGFATDWHLVNAGKLRSRRRRPRHDGVDQGRAQRLRHGRRSRHCGTTSSSSRARPLRRPSSRSTEPWPASSSAIPAARRGSAGRGRAASRCRATSPRSTTGTAGSWLRRAPIAHSEQSPTPRALDAQRGARPRASWGKAARRAHEAGFDVVEIHAAHGYLMHQFLSRERQPAHRRIRRLGDKPHALRRSRWRNAVRADWPAEKPLFMRLSCEDDAGWGPEQSVRLAKLLKAKGVDVIDCSSGGMTDGLADGGADDKYGYQVPYRRKDPEQRRHHDHGGRPDRPWRPGRGDPARRPGRPDRGGARDHDTTRTGRWMPPKSSARRGRSATCRRNSATGSAPAPSAVLAPSPRPGRTA